MASTIEIPSAHETLLGVIRRVRARWRLKLALRGAAIVLGALVVAVLVGAYIMQTARFAPGAITGVRIAAYVVLAVLLIQYMVRPLLRRASDEHIALYLEEHEPSLDAAVLSAVEHGKLTNDTPDRSPLLARRLIESAIERSHQVSDGARVDQPGILRAAMFAGAATLIGFLAVGIGPAFLRDGARLLLAPWRSAEAAQPYAIAVLPGNATVPKGGDQEVSATLRGFTAEGVQLAVRRGGAAEWERLPMTAGGDSAHFSIRLFDIAERTEYYVESNGVRSALFRLDVANLPYVKKIDLEYRYPSYTGMASETVADGGDIAAPRGTTVIVHATTTMPVKGGRLLIEGKEPTPLTINGDGSLTAPIQVLANGFYKLELQTQAGDFIPGSLDYTINVLDDRPPTISFEKPGRDTKVTAVDEVFTQVKATDDYGVSTIDLMYSVNGGPEKTVSLRAGGQRLREVLAGHTFFLEELGLKPGDLVSYYARARDNGGNGQEAKTDIYFMSVRPFDQTYKQAEGGGGGAPGDDPGELTERQRQVIAGTFKVDRDRKTTPPNQLRENFATLNLSQGRIREAVETLIRRMMERNITAIDTAFKIIAEELPQASKEMQVAEEKLLARNSADALPPEQRALQHLQRAEAAFKEYQIMRGQGGGGGGNKQSNAEDLADLFELDADKLRNQYETVDRGTQQQQADNQVDETAEKMKQLASRLQQENERLKNGMRGQPGQQSGGGGAGQRQLADEAEQMARQLERLVRENPQNADNDKLEESARRLQDAANAMRRSATGANDGGVSQGAAALDRLQEARRLLDENRSARTARDLEDAVRKAEKISKDQQQIAGDMDKLGKGMASGSVDPTEANRLQGRQKEMEGDVRQLEGQLDRMRRDSQKDHAEASKKMQEAVTSMRENRLADRVQASQRLTQALTQGRTSPEYAKQFESTITEGVEEMRQKVNEAAAASRGEADGQAAGKSLDRARDLVRGQESLADRMRQRRLGEGGDPADTSHANAQGSKGAPGNQQAQAGKQSAQGGRQNGQDSATGQQQGQNDQQSKAQNGQQGKGQNDQQSKGQNDQQSKGQKGQNGQNGQQQGQAGQPGQQGQGQSGQQGQNGQQGGKQQDGQSGQGGANSQINQQGPGGPIGGNQGGVPNRPLSADDIRQFSREFKDQRQSAEQLKRDLQQMGIDPSDLNRMIEQMRQLENAKSYDDPASLERLQQSLIEGLKAFEFALRRQVEGNDRARPVLGASGDVPAGFRQMVDEYYRSLSKKQQK